MPSFAMPFPLCYKAFGGVGLKGAALMVSVEPSDQFVYRKENDEFFEGVLKETFKCIVSRDNVGPRTHLPLRYELLFFK